MKPSRPTINIDPNKLPTEVCQCGSYFWKDVRIIKEVPGLLVGSIKNEFMFFDITVCAKCETPHFSVQIKLPTKEELPKTIEKT